jgi:hypothetical protein
MGDVCLPEIVYFQTITACNGHCVYCPFDDIYTDVRLMKTVTFMKAVGWLASNGYKGRIGFLLHCEPTMDERLPMLMGIVRGWLPDSSIEVATNGLTYNPALDLADVVDVTPPNSLKEATSRAGNVRACKQIEGRKRMAEHPCTLPQNTMCIAYNGSVLLCCQDWRHQAVCGTVDDLTAARGKQQTMTSEICHACMNGLTYEEANKPNEVKNG